MHPGNQLYQKEGETMAGQNKNQKREPQVDETTGKGNPELIGQPPHPTPGQAEGDRETVEESLRQKERDAQNRGDKDV